MTLNLNVKISPIGYITTSLILLFSVFTVTAQTTKIIKINADKTLAKVQPNMWGVFFEDINFGADGGIYAELVKNRSFEFPEPLMGWDVNTKKQKDGEILVLNQYEKNPSNPRYLQITKENDDVQLINKGFRGMGIKKGLRYDFSLSYRLQQPGITMVISLLDEAGKEIGKTDFTPKPSSKDWLKEKLSFVATETSMKGKLSIVFKGSGQIDLDMISLFPGDTWKNRPNGLRADMVKTLEDMKPGFIRFPGGCIVEGRDMANRYQWKNTIGPIEDRKLLLNRWNLEVPNRQTPDYFQTFGLGFFEYFQLSEDIGAEPLPILNAGMACQYNTAEVVSLSELGPYVQDALDLIEFANGAVETTWGKKRAEMGHPKPFNLKMLGIGNENFGPQYVERLKMFTAAIGKKYPNIKVISSAGTDADGRQFDYLNKELRAIDPAFIDEHYYRSAEWFLKNAGRYDNYPRTGSKVFAGEYAVHSGAEASGVKRNNWQSALAAAAFMTGLERNADVVEMASYAPLFAHINAFQWSPDLIWVDNLNIYGSPDFYVQKLFSINKGTDVTPITLNNEKIVGQDGLYASSVLDETKKELIIKIVNSSNKTQQADFEIAGNKKFKKTAQIQEIANGNLIESNSMEKPKAVSPVETTKSLKGKNLNYTLKPYSFNVIKIKYSK
ncbi:alpha-L-arabinofuranosidase [Pedobacter changchengzhani]|uniref:non-reducing end alpha-L-arabinofuranosidase n=1 Tax=Pedobacter changchengzhani TaxID=2529274 RepID=A0A4R5MJU4_9SPHI|nr:alpha-L-arabinofuranosidase C-terminal domain-containing protein [Pedobacter changchengzhani]TDG35904.1 alpha-L-arabinofuranosidase [Pedobacter changchengzhani]